MNNGDASLIAGIEEMRFILMLMERF